MEWQLTLKLLLLAALAYRSEQDQHASSVFPAEAPMRESSSIPSLLFPQCKVDGFWSNHALILTYIYVARMLVQSGVEFKFVVPDLYFHEQPNGILSKIGNQSFGAVYDIEHLERFLGVQAVGQGAIGSEGRIFERSFFVTTRPSEGDKRLINERGDIFHRCAGPEGLQAVSSILPSAHSVLFRFNTKDFIAELAELLTRNAHERALFIVHGVPKSVVQEAQRSWVPAASGSAELNPGEDGISAMTALHLNSVLALTLSAPVRDAAILVRSLWNISAARSWIHLHIRRGLTPALPGWDQGQISGAEIEFALERAFHEVPGCLSGRAPGAPAVVVVSSVRAIPDAIFIQTLYPEVEVRLFDEVLWDTVQAHGIPGWTGEQIFRDLVEVQMMRDAGVFIGSRSCMSEEQFHWRALTRGDQRRPALQTCNINGQPCFRRRADYHLLLGAERLSCLGP